MAKIIVIGAISTKDKNAYNCLKLLGISKDNVDFYSDYKKIKNINFSFLRNSTRYSDVLLCSIPHKMVGTEGYSSFIKMIEDNQSEFPQLIKIGNLKYSKDAFIKALLETKYYKERVLSENYV